MHEVVLRLRCKRPEIAKKSLDPDIKNTKSLQTKINANEEFLEIKVKGKKMSHIKAVINSYLSIVGLLDEIEDIK